MSDAIVDQVSDTDSVAAVRRLARTLDAAVRIPGTNVRIGLDALLGLVPGIGDVAGAALSGYIVLAAARMGVPRSVLARMLVNLGIDAVVGSVPLVGDLFDVGWKANMRNVALIEGHVAAPGPTRASSRKLVAGITVAIVALGALAVVFTVLAVRTLIALIS